MQGIVLIGLSASAFDLLETYVNRTADVQVRARVRRRACARVCACLCAHQL